MAVLMAVFMVGYALPEGVSTVSPIIDSQFHLTLAITGIAFLLAQFALGFFIWRYRGRGEERAQYLEGNNRLEMAAMLLTLVVFVALGIKAQFLWAEVHVSEPPENALKVEVLAQQFIWNIRYPGEDGLFGESAPRFYDDATNPLGIDPEDPAGKDDRVLLNQVVVPVGRPVTLILRSKDVIHNFYMPHIRLKQDAVPGLEVPLTFTATRTGTYDVLCAELCGLAHYRMRATLKVLEPEEFEKWLAEKD